MFDEEPGRDSHEQCRYEIQRLEAERDDWHKLADLRSAEIARLRKVAWDVVNKTWQANEHEQCFFDALRAALEACDG